MNEQALAAALDSMKTPDSWKRDLLTRAAAGRHGRSARGKWPAVVLAAVLAAALSAVALAAADPAIKKWMLQFVNITPQIDISGRADDASQPDAPSNIAKTKDFGTDYRVADGFLILHADEPDQKIYAYADGSFVESEPKTCAGKIGAFSFSFQYVQNGEKLYPYGNTGSADFTVAALPGHDGVGLLFTGTGAEKAMYQIDLATGGVARTLPLPGAFSGCSLSPDGSRAVLKLSTQTEGAFDWSLMDLSTGRRTALDSVVGSTAAYDVYFYDDTTLILVLYSQDETRCSFKRYDLQTGTVQDLGDAANTPGGFWADRSSPWIKQLDAAAGRLTLKNIVTAQAAVFDVAGLLPRGGPSATYGDGRFFICEVGTARFVIFDAERQRVSTVDAADIHCSTLQFVSLVDDGVMLLSGKTSPDAAPAFYLVNLSG